VSPVFNEKRRICEARCRCHPDRGDNWLGGAQEAEAILQHLDHPFADDSTSWAARFLRIGNINSCLRITLAFSTATDSANVSKSVAVLFLILEASFQP